MESKLPKPTGLKRPNPVVKNILPMDRIKMAASNKLQINTTNSQTTYHRVSPDIHKYTTSQFSRAKLRRSRSACDIRELPRLKRVEETLAPIPSKMARLNFNTNVATSNTTNGPTRVVYRYTPASATMGSTGGAIKKTVTATATTTTTLTSATSTSIFSRTAINARVKPTVDQAKRNVPKATTTTKTNNSNSSSNATSVSTTGVGKTINKRIPPYDFKARYYDLLEKHKKMKENYDQKCEILENMENLPEQLEESQSTVISLQEQLKSTEIERQCIQNQLVESTTETEKITLTLGRITEELWNLEKEHNTMKNAFEKEQNEMKTKLNDVQIELEEKRVKCIRLMEENDQQTTELKISKEQLFRSNMERKELHNVVMDLRGNIRVFCRIRPSLDTEQDRLLCGWNYIDESTVEIINTADINKNKTTNHIFNFDQVFDQNAHQDEIFELVSPLIQSAMDGYNICIFAYGQTGSGKTYTMDGLSTNPGVIPRTVDLLFDSIKNYKNLGWEYKINATFLEIYNEVLYDLLSNEQKDMEIRMVKNSKNEIYVSNISEETVTDAQRLRYLMDVAKMNRATAATIGNDRSSRSHAVTRIELIGTHTERNQISIGTINLVDLAGSESPKTSIRMNETKNINRSLSELTNVILALLQKQDHIPYRNSKLTHLLMPSLGGNSKTLMFINVAPFQDCYAESVKSLRFATSVNSCKVAKAKRNRFLNTSTNTSSGSLDK